MEKVLARERELNSERLMIDNNILSIRFYFEGYEFNIEDNGLNNTLSEILEVYESGFDDPLTNEDTIFDGNIEGN